MRSLWQDLRYGYRLIWQPPGFAVVGVMSLALGIAVNTTVFSWIDAVLVRPLPGVADADHLAVLESVRRNGTFGQTSYGDYCDYRDNLKLITGLAVSRPTPFRMGQEGEAQWVWGALISGNFFDVLGVKPVLGRMFSKEEQDDEPGAAPVAVISERLWRSRFNEDPLVVGRTIRVNRHELVVTGVVSAEFHGATPGLALDLWVPVSMEVELGLAEEASYRNRERRDLDAIARLAPGVALEQARAEVKRTAIYLSEIEPATNSDVSATLLPVWKAHTGAQSVLLRPLMILMGVAALVLLIACANVATLLLARSASRQKEFGIRLGLGAGRARLIRQMLTETALLAALAAVIGVAITAWMMQSLAALIPPTRFPGWLDIQVNSHVLAFTLLIGVLAILVAGTAPAFASVRLELSEIMKEGGRSEVRGMLSRRVRSLLIVGEVSLAAMALIGAGLFVRSFQKASAANPGFDAAHVLVSHFDLAAAGYSADQVKKFSRELRERLEEVPGIESVTFADTVPLGFDALPVQALRIDGYTPDRGESMEIGRSLVAPGYFHLLRIPLAEGRDFSWRDDGQQARVMIVNQSFARKFFGRKNPIGRKVIVRDEWFKVVGVVKDSKYQSRSETKRPYFFLPFGEAYSAGQGLAFYIRTKGEPGQAVGALREEVKKIDPMAEGFEAMPLERYTDASLFPLKVSASLLGVLGLLALVLSGRGNLQRHDIRGQPADARDGDPDGAGRCANGGHRDGGKAGHAHDTRWTVGGTCACARRNENDRRHARECSSLRSHHLRRRGAVCQRRGAAGKLPAGQACDADRADECAAERVRSEEPASLRRCPMGRRDFYVQSSGCVYDSVVAGICERLTGRWSGAHTVGGQKHLMFLEFRQAGDALTGVAGIREDFLGPLRNLNQAEGKLTFEFRLPGGPGGKFEGVLDGDRASGQMTFEVAAMNGPFEMRRTGPPTPFPAIAPSADETLGSFSDEFEGADSVKRWKSFNEAEGWPNRIAQMEVRDGQLRIVPSSGAWWAGYHGVYLFKEVAGDFVVTTRLKVTGKGGGEPANIWTISGLLVRSPVDAKIPREQRRENWIYLMTGRGPGEARVVDAKSTVNGNNLWDVTPARDGWYELRIARLGPLFLEMVRGDGEEWTLRKRILRRDLPERLQVGINVTSDFKLSASMPSAKYNAELFPDRSSPDSVTLFDYVRFQAAPQRALVEKLAGRELLGIPDDELVRLVQ